MLKLLGFLGVIGVGLMVWSLVEAISTDRRRIRRLPKGAWILVILLVPLAGAIAWLLAGRAKSAPAGVAKEPDHATRNASNPAEEAADYSTRLRERAEEQRRRYEQQKRKEQDTDSPEA